LLYALAILLRQKKTQGLLYRRVDRGECFALRPGRLTPAEKTQGVLYRRVDRGECFALGPGRLTPAEKNPRDYYIGKWIEVSVLL